MKPFPPDTLTLREAAKKYQLKLKTVQVAAFRKRIETFKRDGKLYTTVRAMKIYLKSRDVTKIPMRYRKKT